MATKPKLSNRISLEKKYRNRRKRQAKIKEPKSTNIYRLMRVRACRERRYSKGLTARGTVPIRGDQTLAVL